MLHGGLREAELDAVQVTPWMPQLPEPVYRGMTLLGRDLRAFLTNYPLLCRYPRADIYHLGQQALTSLLLVRRPKGKVVVTVHDIFPHTLGNDPWFKLAVMGLARVDHIIAISHYTKRCLVEELAIPPDKITVVHHGMNHERFRPLTPSGSLRPRYGLPEGRRFLIYVGTEDPRKNLPILVRALAQVRRELPEVELIKVGWSHCAEERQVLLALAKDLDVFEAIRFLEDVREQDLPQLYNLAEVYVTPSLYEGFGFTLLEAMACGTPTVYADAGSLPEIAANAGAAVAPVTAERLAVELLSVLRDRDRQDRLRAAGRRRAANFTWPASTQGVLAVYTELLRGKSRWISQGWHSSTNGANPTTAR
jgi:glycosyltransferase involved in cell wall biosynthesis